MDSILKDERSPFSIVIKVTPSSEEVKNDLEIIAAVLKVDKELKPDILTKQITFDPQSGIIEVKFLSKQLKLLRSCVTGFLRHMQLTASTIKEFKSE